jgi:3-oxoacyl-[acyl-carrier protein] reductase
VAETFGRIDILVNNAAVTEITSCKSTSEAGIEDWQTLIRVNVEGSLAVIHAVVPAMKARGWGRIVTISSILALGSRIQFGWYATAKATLHGLTRSLYREAGQHGVLINVVMPGLTLTERIVEHFPHLIPSAARSTPIQRLLTPEEVAPVVAFLCSPANTAITGEIIRTSGG